MGLIYPSAIRENLIGLAVLAGLGVMRNAYELMKFGRRASYHMRNAKFWGITLFAAFVVLLGFGHSGLVPLAIVAGIVSDLEGLAASVLLREWTYDVPSVFHARALVTR